MNGEDPNVVAAREEMDAAIKKYVKLKAEVDGHPDIYVSAWAGFAEYESTSLMDQNATGSMLFSPDDQLRSTTRGLFMFGVDAYQRTST